MSKSFRIKKYRRRGFSLVEVIFYVAIVVLVAISSVTFLLSLEDVLARQQAERLVRNTAEVALERILFEARQSEEVDLGQSTLSASSSVLVLNRGAGTVRFEVATGTLYLYENSVLSGPLTPPEVEVSDFYVYRYDNGRTESLRIVTNLSAMVASSTISERLEGGITLRGSYD